MFSPTIVDLIQFISPIATLILVTYMMLQIEQANEEAARRYLLREKSRGLIPRKVV